MAASDAAGAELSKDSEMIKIGSRLWKIGEKVYSIGVEAVEKAKMVETFGDAWRTARAEGEILGRSGIRKVEVKWTNLANPHIQEYGCNHSMFKSDFQNQPQKTPKKRTQSEISSEPSGVIRSDINESCGEILYSSSGEVTESEDDSEGNGGGSSAVQGFSGWGEQLGLDAFDCRGDKPKYHSAAALKWPRRRDSVSDPNSYDYFDLFFPNHVISQLRNGATIHLMMKKQKFMSPTFRGISMHTSYVIAAGNQHQRLLERHRH